MFFDKSHKGPYAMQGFGLDVPYSNAQGSTVMASAGTGTLCGTTGNAIALQAMLADLGFYKGTIDGIMGTGTRDAVKAFASSMSVDPGGYYASGAICQAVMDAYQAKHAPPPPLQPDGPPSPAPPQAKPVVRFIINPALLAAAMAKKSAAPPAPAAPAAGVMGWWGAQSSTMKIGLGVGVAAVLALGIYAAMGGMSGTKTATPNRAKPKPRTCRSKAPKGYPRKRSASTPMMIAAQVDTLSASDELAKLNAAVQAFTVAFDRTTRAREAEEMLRAAELDAAEVA